MPLQYGYDWADPGSKHRLQQYHETVAVATFGKPISPKSAARLPAPRSLRNFRRLMCLPSCSINLSVLIVHLLDRTDYLIVVSTLVTASPLQQDPPHEPRAENHGCHDKAEHVNAPKKVVLAIYLFHDPIG